MRLDTKEIAVLGFIAVLVLVLLGAIASADDTLDRDNKAQEFADFLGLPLDWQPETDLEAQDAVDALIAAGFLDPSHKSCADRCSSCQSGDCPGGGTNVCGFFTCLANCSGGHHPVCCWGCTKAPDVGRSTQDHLVARIHGDRYLECNQKPGQNTTCHQRQDGHAIPPENLTMTPSGAVEVGNWLAKRSVSDSGGCGVPGQRVVRDYKKIAEKLVEIMQNPDSDVGKAFKSCTKRCDGTGCHTCHNSPQCNSDRCCGPLDCYSNCIENHHPVCCWGC